jgi:DNA repair protein RadA/Sms
MSKVRVLFACQACGLESSKWLGRCPDCGEWNSFVEERREDAPAARGRPAILAEGVQSRPKPYDLIDVAEGARTPTGIGEFDRVLGGGLVPGSMVLIGGEPGIGKCLAGSTRLLDPETGALLPITKWARRQRHVVSLDESTQRLMSQPVASFHEQGVRPIVELKTRLGRTLRCTPGHPVLTPAGWKAAGDLRPGTRIASPRALPYFGADRMPDHEVRLVAYILSDGSAQSDVNVTSAIPEVQRDLTEVAGGFGLRLRVYSKPGTTASLYRLVRPRGQRAEARAQFARSLRQAQAKSGRTWAAWARQAGVSYSMLTVWRRAECVPGAAELERLAAAAGLPVGKLLPTARSRAEMTTEAARFLTSLGLRFQTAAGKAVPECIFRLPPDQMRSFLKVLFSCDGSVYVSAAGQSGVSYSTVSERLAHDVQHLLLRFGFVSRLRTKTQRVNGRPYVAYEVQLLGLREVKRFLGEIGIWGRERAKAIISRQASPRGSSTHFDTVPTGEGFWGLLHAATGGAPFSRVSATAGVPLKNRRHERPLCRSTVAALATAYPSPELCRLAEAHVYWDEVQSVVASGEERVYDLSMPSQPNFVANDLIVHNSTLLLQVAHLLGRTHGTVLYVSAEESERQVKMRGERLGIQGGGLFLLAETSLERILELVEEMKPAALVVDSVQTVFSSKFPSAPGSISQVREVATQLLFVAKSRGITTFLIGHVTKDGSLAGPKSLEHIVDTVLYFEGEKRQHHRIVRAVKNRFGAVSEMGVFEMTGAGLKPVANPSALFLAERIAGSPGSAVVATMEGTRPMLVEVQALVSPTSFGTPRRMSLGIDPNRTNLLLAVLEKRVGLELLGDDVFVSVAGGLEVDEPAADLGVAAAIASSFRNRPVPGDTVLFGEVGLAGEVRGAGQAGLRIREAAQMGFTRCILPARNVPSDADQGLRLVGVDTLGQALERLMDDAPSR